METILQDTLQRLDLLLETVIRSDVVAHWVLLCHSLLLLLEIFYKGRLHHVDTVVSLDLLAIVL